MISTWSTTDTEPRRQFEYWRELICEAFLDLSPESSQRDGFAGTVTRWPTGIARIGSQRQRVRRTALDIARAPRAGYYANLQVRGSSVMRQAGRTAVLAPGDLAVVYTDEPFEFEFGTDFTQLSLFVPGPLLPGRVRTATRVGTVAGAGAAARHAMTALAGSPLAPESAARLATLTGGLLAVALTTVESAGTARDHHTYRTYRAALDDIAEHLGDDDLSPPATARRLGLSVRSLHGLFAGRERTYAGTVRRMRLELALRTLRDPNLAHLRVIDVAAEAGFGDVTSFHRAFRREFGRTPASVRQVVVTTTQQRPGAGASDA
jgi:AraC family transcriptional regulator, positive regulator of tynA and feaB